MWCEWKVQGDSHYPQVHNLSFNTIIVYNMCLLIPFSYYISVF
jgi:hypothetical protein